MFTYSKSALTALSAFTMLYRPSSADSAWTCSELEASTDPFYRMFPAYVAKALPGEPVSHQIQNLSGHCFGTIDITTTFSYLDADNT